MEDVVQGGWALVTGRGGGEAEAVAPLTSGEDVANIVEADLFQRLGEAGKGEAAPDSRPGEGGEAVYSLQSTVLSTELLRLVENERFEQQYKK